jgi:hypothetical protein
MSQEHAILPTIKAVNGVKRAEIQINVTSYLPSKLLMA